MKKNTYIYNSVEDTTMKYWFLFIFYMTLSLEINATKGVPSSIDKYSQNIHWAFEENKGQVTGQDSAKVTYFYKQGAKTMYLLHSGIAYQFEKRHYPEGYKSPDKYATREELDSFQSLSKKIRTESYRMDIELIGANRNPEIIAEGKSPDYIQYYNHNALDVHAYQKITYKNIYPNIDWVIYSTNNEQLTTNNLSSNTQNSNLIKYDFIVHAGGNPADIRLQTHWVEDLAVNSDGILSMKNRMGSVIENRPTSYQGSRELSSQFKLENNIISFDISDYNSSQDLIIDPSIIWSTYYGGNGEESYFVTTKTDLKGNVYLSGYTNSSISISSGGLQDTMGGMTDAFLVKFNSNGTRKWATYYGGTNYDNGYSVDTDTKDMVYIAGYTKSLNNISYNGFKNSISSSVGSAFLAKFDSSGNRVWATYYCGENRTNTYGYDCIVDINNNIYMVGNTDATTGISYNGFNNTNSGGDDFFIVKFNESGTRKWATYYGGSTIEFNFNKCKADIHGNFYLVGTTISKGLGYNGFINSIYRQWGHGILIKFDSIGSRKWATYYGGDGICTTQALQNEATDCVIDKSENVYLVGNTYCDSMISYKGFQNTIAGSEDGYIVKFDANGTRLWGSYYGGPNNDRINGCDLSRDDKFLYIVGDTYSNSGIASNGFKNSKALTDREGFIVKLDTDGNRIWSSYYGGNGEDVIYNCAISSTGGIYVSGFTNSSIGLSLNGHQNTYGGGIYDAFLAKIGNRPNITIQRLGKDTICPKDAMSFKSLITNGGTTPQYKWYMNNQLVGIDSQITVYPQLDKDTIYCILYSSDPDRSDDTVMSNKLSIHLIHTDTAVFFDTICANQYYVFNNQNFKNSGLYRDTLISSIGCDSFIFLHLYVKPYSSYSYNFTTSCTNPSYYFNNQTLTQSGIYKDTLTNIYGCDSFITLNLKVVNPSSTSLSITRCPNQPYFFNGQNRTTSGTYTQILTNTQGCDSTITLNLSILTSPSSESNTIWGCTPFIRNGKTYISNGMAYDTLKSIYGCDSVYQTNTIYLKPKPTTLIPIEYTICDSVMVKGIKHISTFTYIDTFRTTADISCDSFYQPVKYTIKYSPNLTISSKQVDTFYKGETVNLYPSQALNYLWQTGEKTRSKSFVINSDQTIYLIGWNDTECRDTAFIQLIALDPTILDFPTGFSPTGNYADNRYFKPNINGKVEKIRFDIFNRLGEKVYFSTQPNMIGWDGTYRGKDCPAGLYSYICEYTTNRRIYFKTGEVMLVR